MGRPSKIKSSAEMQSIVRRCMAQGLGPMAIAKELQLKGHDASHMAVSRYLKDLKDIKGEVLSEDTALTEYVKESIFDTADVLKRINKMLWEMIEEPGVSRKFKLQTISQISKTVKLADELMNQFSGIKIDARGASRVQLFQVVVSHLSEMEKRGDIKILNPKLRTDRTEVVIEHDTGHDGIDRASEENGL